MPKTKEDDSKYKVFITGLWIAQGKSGPNFTSIKLTPEERDKFIEFSKEPCRIVVYRRSKKLNDKRPDGFMYLSRWDDEWKEKKAARVVKDSIEIQKEEEPVQ